MYPKEVRCCSEAVWLSRCSAVGLCSACGAREEEGSTAGREPVSKSNWHFGSNGRGHFCRYWNKRHVVVGCRDAYAHF